MSIAFEMARKPRIESSVQTEIPQQENKFDVFKYSKSSPGKQVEAQESEEQKPTFGQEVERHIGRSLARIGETAIGTPRGMAETGEIIAKGATQLAAKPFGLEKPAEKAIETAASIQPYKLLPETEQIRKNITQHLWGEKYEPKSPGEERADEIISDITALAIPIGNYAKKGAILMKYVRPVFATLGGQLAKETAGIFGAGEKGQTEAKMGGILAASLVNPKGVQKEIKSLYDKEKSLRPSDAKVSTHYLESELNKLEAKFKSGGIEASDKPALDKINDIRKETQGALMPVESAIDTKKKINERLGSLWETEGLKNKSHRNVAKAKLLEVSHALDDVLSLYGTQNSAWDKAYRPANLAYSANAQSMKMRNFIKHHAKGISATTGGLLGASGVAETIAKHGAPLGTLTAAASVAVPTYMVMKSGEILTQIYKSPALRKYYLNTLNAALKEDSVALSQNINKLDAGIKKLEKEKKETEED